MNIAWDTLEQVESALWKVPENSVISYNILIHGGYSTPNKAALNLADISLDHCDYFINLATDQLRSFLKPSITEEGIHPESFVFDDYGNSFWIYFNLLGDSSARWGVRFIRSGSDHITDHPPCEIRRSE